MALETFIPLLFVKYWLSQELFRKHFKTLWKVFSLENNHKIKISKERIREIRCISSWNQNCSQCMLSLQPCLTLCNAMDCSLSCSPGHGDSLGKNTGVGCHAFLQGIFPTQGSNLHLSLTSPALARGFFTTSTTGKVQKMTQGRC